jgi:LacI family transcriptional regulator
MAAATMAVAHRRGLELPGDLSVAGFDDTPLATTVWPELTTIRQPIAEMAREAVRLLFEQIRGRRAGTPPQVAHKMLKFTLVKRESTGESTYAGGRPLRRKP